MRDLLSSLALKRQNLNQSQSSCSCYDWAAESPKFRAPFGCYYELVYDYEVERSIRPLAVGVRIISFYIEIRKIEISTKIIDIWAIFEVKYICCIYFELFKLFVFHSLNKKLVNHSLKKLWQDEIMSAPTARGRCMHVLITKGAGNLGLSASQS